MMDKTSIASHPGYVITLEHEIDGLAKGNDCHSISLAGERLFSSPGILPKLLIVAASSFLVVATLYELFLGQIRVVRVFFSRV